MNEPAFDESQVRQAVAERYTKTLPLPLGLAVSVSAQSWPTTKWPERRSPGARDRSSGCAVPAVSLPADLAACTRKMESMVRGRFRRDDQAGKSGGFLTADNIEQVLMCCAWPHTAYDGRNSDAW